MNSSLFNILIQSIKARLTPIITKLRLWTSWTFIRSRLVIKIREFFYKILGIKPRDKDDYYTIGRWMISKRLVYALVIMIGVASIWYISSETKLFACFDENGVRTYRYNSIRLRTAKGRVRILGKSGYLAYDGPVAGGYAEGEGTLYNPDGLAVYAGDFVQSKYEGQGTLHHPNGMMAYRGTFHENLFEGEGTSYREDGTRRYEGEFTRGRFNGNGILYDTGENELYRGTFAGGEIVYSELLGKTAAETQDNYKGQRDLYYTDEESVVIMDGIGALCYLTGDPEALEEEEIVQGVYVLQDHISFGGEDLTTVDKIADTLGDPVYKGYSGITLPEAVAVNRLNVRRTALSGQVEMEVNRTFSDAAEVLQYDRDYVVHINTFRRGDLLYSFVGGSENGRFEFYFITGDTESL